MDEHKPHDAAEEDRLTMSRRHLREGQGRIERQTLLLTELERDGHTHLVTKARELLTELQRTQAEMEQTLADLKSSMRAAD